MPLDTGGFIVGVAVPEKTGLFSGVVRVRAICVAGRPVATQARLLVKSLTRHSFPVFSARFFSTHYRVRETATGTAAARPSFDRNVARRAALNPRTLDLVRTR
jgi:hypothetical protein